MPQDSNYMRLRSGSQISKRDDEALRRPSEEPDRLRPDENVRIGSSASRPMDQVPMEHRTPDRSPNPRHDSPRDPSQRRESRRRGRGRNRIGRSPIVGQSRQSSRAHRTVPLSWTTSVKLTLTLETTYPLGNGPSPAGPALGPNVVPPTGPRTFARPCLPLPCPLVAGASAAGTRHSATETLTATMRT